MSTSHRSAVPRHEAQVVAELEQIVDRLLAIAEQHHLSIVDLDKLMRPLVRQAQRDLDLDLGLLDVPARDRVVLRQLDTERPRS
jgi:hypothetical protein